LEINMVLDFNNLSDSQVRRLNQLFINEQPFFNGIIGDLVKDSNKDIELLVSILVSRNTYQSKLYHNIVELSLAEELFASDRVEKIIFTSKIQKRIFLANHPRSSILIEYHNKNDLVKTLCKDVVSDLLISFRGLTSRNKSRKNQFKGRSLKLIETFILSNSIKEGRYIDRYYNGLWDLIPNNGKNDIWVLPEILGKYSRRDLVNISKNSSLNFLFKQDFLNFRDYLKAFMKLTLLRNFNRKTIYFKNIDITKLINYEFFRTRFHPTAYKGLLNYAFAKKLKSVISRLNLLIDWNENQPIDKGLIKGVRDFHPGAYIKGYQGYIVSMNFNFYMLPTDYEVELGVIPDVICVVGKALENRIKKFTDKIKVTTAPAFRFQGIFKNYEKISDGTKKILVALPIGVNESYDILTIVSKALILFEKEKKFQLLIKPHPLLNISKLRKMMGSMWNKGFKMVNGDFNELVSQMDLLIGSTSTTLLETLTRGVPVIVIGSQNGITQNPIPDSMDKRIWSLCYSHEELSNAVEQFLNISDKNQFLKIGENIRNEYFEPITKQSVLKFLSLS